LKIRILLPALLAVAVFFRTDIFAARRCRAPGACRYRYRCVYGRYRRGHGGEDGGAVSITGVRESALNLDIAEKLDLILAFYGVRTVMTRTSETLNYSDNADTVREKKAEDQKRRLALIEAENDALLISIHQNNYPDGGPFGAQVFYAPTDGSKLLADSMQQLLVIYLNPQNRRTAVKIPSNILLMNNVSCPAVLVECGFLSNPAEEQLLRTPSYRLKLAAVVAAGFLYNKESFENHTYGGPDES
jgi:N-acetylmuramoyl-L-alanine amidase